MKPRGLKVGQHVLFDGEIGRVDSFSWDMFTGEQLVIVDVLGELKVVHPESLSKVVKK